MKKRWYGKFLIIVSIICLICMGFLISSPVDSQFSTSTLFPLNGAVGYGGFFNPYVFWPSSQINAAASTSPLITFSALNNGDLGLGNLLGIIPQLGNNVFNPINLLTNQINLLGLGLGNPLGTLSFLGNSILNPLALAPFSPFGSGLTASFGTVSPIRTAAQSGTWIGTWTSTYIAFIVLFNSGPMMLNIVEDPLLGTVIGTTILQGSRYASALTEVAGVIVNNVITLEGFLFTGFDIGLTCYLTSPTTMEGFYTVYGTNTPLLDQGIFSLTLSPAII